MIHFIDVAAEDFIDDFDYDVFIISTGAIGDHDDYYYGYMSAIQL